MREMISCSFLFDYIFYFLQIQVPQSNNIGIKIKMNRTLIYHLCYKVNLHP